MPEGKKKKWERGNIKDCLKRAYRHVTEEKPEPLMFSFTDLLFLLNNIFRVLSEELQEAIQRVKLIEEIARRQENQEILDVLNEEFEFGYDKDYQI